MKHSLIRQGATIHAGTATEAFVGWVGREARADSVDLLLFVGEASKLCALAESVFRRCLYLPTSNTAVIAAEVDVSDTAGRVQSLMSMGHGQKLREFFYNLGIPVPAETVLRDLGLHSEMVIEASTSNLFCRFLYAYRTNVFKVCRQRRRELFQYFLDSGIRDGMRIGIVDVGWNADVQTSLGRTLHAMFEVGVYSYSFCLRDDAAGIGMRSVLRTKGMISSDS